MSHSTRLHTVPVACELYLLCRRTSDDLKVFSAVFLHEQGMQSPENLLDVILRRREKKNPIQLECWRKINTKFPSGLCPHTILFPCQPQQFCFCLILLSPGTLMNSAPPAQRFLHYSPIRDAQEKGVICAPQSAQLQN